MTDWGQGYVWGLMSGLPVAIMLVGMLCVGREEEGEGRSFREGAGNRANVRPWADENGVRHD